MVFQRTRIYFNEFDYPTLDSIMNIITKTALKWRKKCCNNCFKLLLSDSCQKKSYYKHTMINVGVWLSCYVYFFAIWAYLTTVNQWWAMFFSKDFVWLERCSLDEAKNSTKPFEKVELSKIPMVNSLFLTNSYVYIRNILLKSGLTVEIFFNAEQTFGLPGDIEPV